MKCTYTTKKDLYLSGGVMSKGTILYLERDRSKNYAGSKNYLRLRSLDGRRLAVPTEVLYECFKLIFHLQIDLL